MLGLEVLAKCEVVGLAESEFGLGHGLTLQTTKLNNYLKTKMLSYKKNLNVFYPSWLWSWLWSWSWDILKLLNKLNLPNKLNIQIVLNQLVQNGPSRLTGQTMKMN